MEIWIHKVLFSRDSQRCIYHTLKEEIVEQIVKLAVTGEKVPLALETLRLYKHCEDMISYISVFPLCNRIIRKIIGPELNIFPR